MKKLFLISVIALVLCGCKKEVAPTPAKVVIVKPLDTAEDNEYIRLTLVNLNNPIESDQDLIVFNHDASTKYVPGEDAPYFGGGGATSLRVLSSDGIALAIDHTPYKSGLLIIPAMSLRNASTYALKLQGNTIPASIHVWLKDSLNADSTDLTTGPYNFTETAGVHNTRFKIEFK